MIEFAYPRLLALVPVAWAMLLLLQRIAARRAFVRFSGLALLAGVPRGVRARTGWVPSAVRLLAVTLAVVALAQPRVANTKEIVEGEGIDIALVLDISGSMRALDFQPDDRLAVAKRVLHQFIDGRKQDRIALVVFAAKAFTQCPLTLDYGVLHRFLDEVRIGLIDDGTAIGLGVATGVKRLARSEAKSKVLILVTDGVNNVPTVDPVTAAEAARSLQVKIYAVGVGKEGLAPYPVDHPVLGRQYTQIETQIDEELMTRIAQQTGGQYFRAQDSESLHSIFQVIDELEKTKVETTIYTNYRQLASLFLLPAALLLVAEAILLASVYRVLP
jgi:Ca-activated chloride channel family protein